MNGNALVDIAPESLPAVIGTRAGERRYTQPAVGSEERFADASNDDSSPEKPVHSKIWPMSLAPGSRLGGYEVTAHLGAGGMGEVYLATDTKLKRKVAIKVLPEAFAADPDRVARFHREAQAVAALNHSGIAAIYDLAEAGGTTFLVLELVEGETLAQRLASRPARRG